MPSSRYARRRQGSKMSKVHIIIIEISNVVAPMHSPHSYLTRRMQELQHKTSRSSSGFESSTRGDRSTNNCIFRQSINKQINTGYPAKYRTRFMQWPVRCNLTKHISKNENCLTF